MPYIFVAAALIAVVTILIIFKISIEKIKENPDAAEKAKINFFIGVATAEIIPILLIVYGFLNIEKVASIEELYLPGLIIILAVGIASFFIFLQRTVGVEERARQATNLFAVLSLGLVSAFPIISIVALFTMIP